MEVGKLVSSSTHARCPQNNVEITLEIEGREANVSLTG